MSKGYIPSIQLSKSNLLILAIPIFLGLMAILASSAPTSTGDNWKIVFDAGIDKPNDYSSSFTPKVWLYNQGNNTVSGATVTYTYFDVNGNSQITTGTTTGNGDGSYSGAAINMPNYAGKYINVLFSVTAGSNTIREQHVYYAGQSNAAKGALWKVEVYRTSAGPSWNGNSAQKIYVKLYSDAGTPYRNNQIKPAITIRDSAGAVYQTQSNIPMTDEDVCVYSYTTAPPYANGEYYFEIYNEWSGQPTGGKTRYTKVYAGLYLEANNAQGDEASPDIVSVERKPYFPADDDNVNITAVALDNVNIASVTLYYTINNQTVQAKTMNPQPGLKYAAQLPPYLMEDNVRYWVQVNDGTNTASSGSYKYNVQDHRGTANMSHSFLSHPVYWVGKSRQASFVDNGGDTNFDGTYSTTEKDYAAYLGNSLVYPYFKDMSTIKVRTLIMSDAGRPMQNLTNVKAWLSNNTNQS